MTTPTVAVVTMGGTICCTSADGGLGGLIPSQDATAGVDLAGVTMRPVAWSLIDSSEVTFAELLRLAHEVPRLVAEGVAGVVITQGTDSVDETAYAFSLLRPVPQPVVFTAAMRTPSVPGSDAPANLAAAVATAVDPRLASVASGTVVVMNDQIHPARWVHKEHTQRLDAFSSGGAGALGVIAEGAPVFLRRDPEPVLPALLDTDTGAEVEVALFTAAMDQDTRLLDAVPRLGYDGLVIEGMGGGHVSGQAALALEEAARTMPVVFSSRTRNGAVLTQTYGSPGAELDLMRRGCVPSGLLSGIKVRVLLTLLLRSGFSREEIHRMVAAEGGMAPAV